MSGPDPFYTLTILGCGSSGGVPRVGNNWGACDPANPKNRRRRCSLLIQRFNGAAVTSVLVDTSPDARMQLLDAGIGWLDGVIISHEHADHTHGIDELRVVALNGRDRVKVYSDARVGTILKQRFGYCFVQAAGSAYPPILDLGMIEPLKPFQIDGPGGPIDLTVFEQIHGSIISLGVRVGDVAYSSDISDVPDASLPILEGLDTWIVDALRSTPHPTHFSVSDALHWIGRMKPDRAILTNLHTDLDYADLGANTPDHVAIAYDMMQIRTGCI